MILGIGVDLCYCPRIEKIYEDKGDIFLNKILTKKEKKAFSQLGIDSKKNEFIASRWATKEAFSKALGVGIGASCRFQDICVVHNDFGKPLLLVEDSSPTYDYLKNLTSDYSIHLSLTHEQKYTQAFVIIEKL